MTQPEEPVRVSRCFTAKGSGSSMELQASNSSADPVSYSLRLYWFDSTGREAYHLGMVTEAIQPGKTVTLRASGYPGDSEGWTCDVKVLGIQ